MNRKFHIFTLCILARQTLKYILTQILLVAMLWFWLLVLWNYTESSGLCHLNVVGKLGFWFLNIYHLKTWRNKKFNLARNPVALWFFLNILLYRWEDPNLLFFQFKYRKIVIDLILPNRKKVFSPIIRIIPVVFFLFCH